MEIVFNRLKDVSNIYNQALERITDQQVRQRLIEANDFSLPPTGARYDCWMAVMFILGQTDDLFTLDKNGHRVEHLRKTHLYLPEFAKPQFLSLAVDYQQSTPIHIGLVLQTDKTTNGIYIWSKPGSSIAKISTAEQELAKGVTLRYFDAGLK